MATKTIKAWIDGAIQNIEVEDVISPAQPISVEERVDKLEDKHEVVIAEGNFLVGNGTEDLEEMTPDEVLSHINGASVRTLTTAEYEAMDESESNANTLYMLTDADSRVDLSQNDPTQSDYVKNRTHYSEIGAKTLLNPTSATKTTDATYGEIWQIHDITVALEVGKTYIVNYNGVDYICEGKSAPEGIVDDPTAVCLGNFAAIGGEDTGEPFALIVVPKYTIVQCMDLSSAESVTIGISCEGEIVHTLDSKYLTADVPHLIESENVALEETTLTKSDYFFETAPLSIKAGDICTITYNGTDYVCTAQSADGLDGAVMIEEEQIFRILNAPGQICYILDLTNSGITELTIKIVAKTTQLYKLDERLMPDSYLLNAGKIVEGQNFTINGNSITAETGAEIFNNYTNNIASGEYSHAEGSSTIASGASSHAEGSSTTASGGASHAEGTGTTASGDYSHAEGNDTIASGSSSHAEGTVTTASGWDSHAEGRRTTASGNDGSHAEGNSDNKVPNTITSESTNDDIINAWKTNRFTLAKGSGSHAEGGNTLALGIYSHAEGIFTIASDGYSHAEGAITIASGESSHAEGDNTTASGQSSHAEGTGTKANGSGSHAEGSYTTASGNYSHAEGSHTTASGNYSHAEGDSTTASSRSQYVQGEYNIIDTQGDSTTRGTYAHIVGNGTSEDARSNAHTLDWDGNAWYQGSVEADSIILRSSTEGSTKKFKLTIDDNATLTITEVTT